MKLGILTFHSQLNYGGVLQAFALQEALRENGYESTVIDRWLTPENRHLELGFLDFSIKGKVRFLLDLIVRVGQFSYLKRRLRTKRFLRANLRLSKPSFFDWNEVPRAAFDADAFIVGSDQVWHCGDWGNPRPYLLEGAPDIPAISYAASFGMRSIPEGMRGGYRAGFARFSAISCREAEGVKLVEQEGFSATHVVDPTLLLNRDQWYAFSKVKTDRKLVCYLLQEDIPAVLPKLDCFAKEMKCTVRLYVNHLALPFPKNVPAFKRWIALNWMRTFGRVKLELAAGPKEFTDAHASAKWVLTDSFHSVMFSSIFDKNVRVIRPSSEMRKAMFARIEEFAAECVEGEMIADSLDDALSSFAKGEAVTFTREKIEALRARSLAWLENALANLHDA